MDRRTRAPEPEQSPVSEAELGEPSNPVTVRVLTSSDIHIHFSFTAYTLHVQFSDILICRLSTLAGDFSLPSSHVTHFLHLAAIPGQESCLNNTSALRQYIKHEARPQSRIDTSLRNLASCARLKMIKVCMSSIVKLSQGAKMCQLSRL